MSEFLSDMEEEAIRIFETGVEPQGERVSFKRGLAPWFEDVAASLGRRQFDSPARRWLNARRQSTAPSLCDPFAEWEG